MGPYIIGGTYALYATYALKNNKITENKKKINFPQLTNLKKKIKKNKKNLLVVAGHPFWP
jgi:hypothetical protein